MIEVDVRGFSCPIPVVRAKKAIEENPKKILIVLVETSVSKENVSRLAESQGYSVKVEEASGEYRLIVNVAIFDIFQRLEYPLTIIFPGVFMLLLLLPGQ